MPPNVYEAIQHIATNTGLLVGEWLASLHVLDYRLAGSADDDEDAKEGFRRARKRFLVLTAEASRLLEMLFEFIDADPRVADDDSVARTLATLEAKQKKLNVFLKRECPERYPDSHA